MTNNKTNNTRRKQESRVFNFFLPLSIVYNRVVSKLFYTLQKGKINLIYTLQNVKIELKYIYLNTLLDLIILLNKVKKRLNK